MRALVALSCTICLAALPSAALCQTEGSSKASPVVVSGGATLVSDYRYRGVSQSDRRPAIQGTLAVTASNGLYGSIWSSSIDDYVANGADQEIDFSVGFKRGVGATTFDVGVCTITIQVPAARTPTSSNLTSPSARPSDRSRPRRWPPTRPSRTR